MKPRTTVVVAGGLFALATFVAIIVVLTGGGDDKRKHRRIADVADEADGYGGVVHYHMMPSVDPLAAARRAAAVRREIRITVRADRIEIIPLDFPVSHSLQLVERTGRPPELVWADVAGIMQALHVEDDTNEAAVQIEAGSDIPYNDVTQVMDTAKSVGFMHLGLSTH